MHRPAILLALAVATLAGCHTVGPKDYAQRPGSEPAEPRGEVSLAAKPPAEPKSERLQAATPATSIVSADHVAGSDENEPIEPASAEVAPPAPPPIKSAPVFEDAPPKKIDAEDLLSLTLLDTDVMPPQPAGEGEKYSEEDFELQPIDLEAFGTDGPPLSLDEVIGSVLAYFPLVDAAQRERLIAQGRQLEASGAFDTKIVFDSNNQPLGFYPNYRQHLKVVQPLMTGGYALGQYRIGRGFFEEWQQERQTNDGGEFKLEAGLNLWRDDLIDERRALLAIANLDRQAAEPLIRSQLIDFVYEASLFYWDWVAAAEQYQIAERLLQNAADRADGVERRVELGDLGEIVLVDNERLIVSRRAKLISAEQKAQQAAVKLSLYFRTTAGAPVIPAVGRLPEERPEPGSLYHAPLEADLEMAYQRRPELALLNIDRRQLDVELNQARNLFQPQVDISGNVSKDVGAPTSKKKDKTPTKMEAFLTISTPVQRRKALGKMRQLEEKIAQLNAKARFTREKIAAEVRGARVALEATAEQYRQAKRALELTRRVEEAERRKFELGDSDLFALNLREQQTAEAAADVVFAEQAYWLAEAEYRAALGLAGN